MYKLVLLPEAEKSYNKLFVRNKELFERIDAALALLCENPLLGKPLKDKLKGKYSLRIGVYRIIYSFQRSALVIYVLDIGHRREVYR